MIQWVFFKLDIARKVCWMCHVYGLTTKGFWFFLIAIIIYSARSIIWERSVSCLLNFEFTGRNLTVALHGLATRRLQSLFWFQKLIKVSKIYSILHLETILCIFWILSLTLLSNLGSNLIPQFSELSVTQCKYMWTRSFEWIDL